jgi:predicted PurR-regulated permease PerM
MLRDGRRARTVFRECVPLSADETDELITNISSAISATVFGNGVVAIVQGALAGLAYWAIGLPSPLLWTLVTTLLCLVPILGAPVIWGPAALFLAIGGEYGRAIGLVLWGLLVVGTIDNVLRPILIGSRTKMHPLPVFFAAVGGTFVMGPLGLFMGPAILSSFGVLLQMHRNRRSDSASASIAA